jgi:hypothetical protein
MYKIYYKNFYHHRITNWINNSTPINIISISKFAIIFILIGNNKVRMSNLSIYSKMTSSLEYYQCIICDKIIF